MDSKKLTGYRKMLLSIRTELIGDVEKNWKLNQENSGEPIPDISDDASQSHSRQLMLELGEQEWQKLKQVEEALEKIDNGDYGTCIQCEQAIPEARLEVIPFANYCVDCLSEIEKGKEMENHNLL